MKEKMIDYLNLTLEEWLNLEMAEKLEILKLAFIKYKRR